VLRSADARCGRLPEATSSLEEPPSEPRELNLPDPDDFAQTQISPKCTNKNDISDARGGPWTPKFRELLNRQRECRLTTRLIGFVFEVTRDRIPSDIIKSSMTASRGR
jgi:hypothetical protein